MNDQEISALFTGLYTDLNDLESVLKERPLLAHYTSVDVLEKIMVENEIWLSNPLFMNDLEEVRFGVQEGARLFLQSDEVPMACGSPSRSQLVKNAFVHFYTTFENEHAFDTYVFCLSQHDPSNNDGLLSMWRGYGAQGNGAALVFNTTFLEKDNPDSPLILTKVQYGSGEKRIDWLRSRLSSWCAILKNSSIPDDKLYIAVYYLFEGVKFFALKSKHDGFKEEDEWRIIYMPERDRAGVWKHMFRQCYVVGSRGVEPKLAFKIKPFAQHETWTFADILEKIILGPSLSSALAQRSVRRMLETMEKHEFKDKVVASRIPLRPSS